MDNILMSTLSSGFSQFFFDVVLWVIGVIIAGIFGYRWYMNKMIYKYTFIEWYDPKNFKVRKARLIKTKKGIKKFQLKGYTDPTTLLQVNQPNGFFNGQPCRHVSWDGMGNIAYLEGVSIDKDEYLKTALTPVERTEAIDAQMESAEKGINMTTMMKWGIGVITIVTVFLMITVIMVAKYGFEQTDNMVGATKNLVIISGDQKATQEMINANTIAMSNLASMYAKMHNISIIQELGTS